MNENPLVSVIIPTYNRKDYVAKAIDSVLTQTYKNIEIIVVDDCSKDGTFNIISALSKKDSRIIVLRNEVNLGHATTLNKGIKAVKGEYVARLDDDDYWYDEKKLEKQVAFLEKNKDYVLVGGGAIKTDKNGKELLRYLLPEKDEEIRKEILISNVFVHISVLFRRDAFKKAGGYDKKFNGFEDWDFWLRMGTIGKFYNLQQILVCYSAHQYKNPSYFDYKRLESLKIRIEMKKKYRNYYPGYKKAILFCFVSYFYYFFPFKDKLFPLTLKMRKLIFGKAPYKYF